MYPDRPLSPALMKIFKGSLTCGDLDSAAIEPTGLKDLSTDIPIDERRAVSNYLRLLNLPGETTIIPSGLTWQWLQALPLDGCGARMIALA